MDLSNYRLDKIPSRLLAFRRRDPNRAVRQAPAPKDPIRVIHFTDLVSRQCSRSGRRDADRLVCDAIANGSRRTVEPRGARGGPVILFEGAGRGLKRGCSQRIRVLGELTQGGCVALLLVSRLKRAKKSPKNRDF